FPSAALLSRIMSSSVITHSNDRSNYYRFCCIRRHVEVFARVLVGLNALGALILFIIPVIEKQVWWWYPILDLFDLLLLIDGLIFRRMYSLLFCLAYRVVNIGLMLTLTTLQVRTTDYNLKKNKTYVQLIFAYSDYFYYNEGS
ncbi:hypothetical protein PMAYCL1PPCAC_05193, partial [Pristionchus mayeri]